MAIGIELADRFHQLFNGLDRAYGVYDLSKPSTREDGKKVGRAATKVGKVDLKLWEDHLSGLMGLGVVPIKDGNVCSFGAIDVDDYTISVADIVKSVAKSRLPLAVTRSKSGGGHIWLFCREPVQASLVQSKLKEIASLLGYGKSEIFPKQTQILEEAGDVGQWINMPYFNGMKGARYGISAAGDPLSMWDFLDIAENLKVDETFFEKIFIKPNDAFVDGPPCLQALAQIGFPDGSRNDGLYNVGVFLKKSRPDDWEKAIGEYNHMFMQPPLETREVQGVAKSLKRKSYAYACQKQPISHHCNAPLCHSRRFGVSDGHGSKFPSLGGLTKLDCAPPIWFWTINSKRVELSTMQMQDPRAFQQRCMEVLNVMPPIPNRAVWESAVQTALDSVTIVEVPKDSSIEGQFVEMLEKFCNGRARALTRDEMLLGKPYTEDGRTYFRMSDLKSFLDRHKFNEFRLNKLTAVLKDLGAKHHFDVLKGRGTNYWSVSAFVEQSEGHSVPKEVEGDESAF